jgi:predicted transport protein
MNINPDGVELKDYFIKEIRNIGHWGTGQLQVIIKNKEAF